MGRKVLLPESFKMVIDTAKKTIIDPTMGVHDQFVVTVNGVEIARTIDEELCNVIKNFLGQNITKCFGKTKQGRQFLEMFYLIAQKEKLTPEYDSKGSLVVRDINDKTIIH